MRKFLEIYVEQTQEEIDRGIPQQVIRFDVSDKTEEEIVDLRDKIVSTLGLKNFKSFIHICYHDEGPTKPCQIFEIT
mgnify:CR=1 FL=1